MARFVIPCLRMNKIYAVNYTLIYFFAPLISPFLSTKLINIITDYSKWKSLRSGCLGSNLTVFPQNKQCSIQWNTSVFDRREIRRFFLAKLSSVSFSGSVERLLFEKSLLHDLFTSTTLLPEFLSCCSTRWLCNNESSQAMQKSINECKPLVTSDNSSEELESLHITHKVSSYCCGCSWDYDSLIFLCSIGSS